MVGISLGRLYITPASGAQVPGEWLAEHAHSLIVEILQATGVDGIEYLGYSTGTFGGQFPGVALQFSSIITGESSYAIFNANLKRARPSRDGSSKAGEPLPKGQFRVGKRSLFCKCWVGAGLELPPRLCRFYERMGKLGGIIFHADRASSRRLVAATLRPLNIPAQVVSEIILSDTQQTAFGQLADKQRTQSTDRKNSQGDSFQGFQQNSSACPANCDSSNQGATVPSRSSSPLPSDQSTEEWLAALGDDYGSFTSTIP